MSRLTILDNIAIASPCPAEWSEMAGDDRTRFCGSCSKHVYDISAMTAAEATALILENEGHLCARVYRRSDGTVLTADCPVGLSKVGKGRRLRRALAMGLILPGLLVAGVAGMGIKPRAAVEPFPTGPGTTWDDRLDWVLITLGLRKPTPPPAIMGKIGMPKPSAAFPPNGSIMMGGIRPMPRPSTCDSQGTPP